ncbi:hypothetical protein LOZ12_006620 [Ophidiomyces ophidiicola]|uniref:Uncharacterized protein n=1 Tax=Ophidiomyces ophidiicola TaxID=1387563 RepID=A0ACB8US66_9EURO|nr:hypothetical protein LOZ64_006654 [Ophidiomyces ophidiicola]KAI1910249.1 hypothetical protein LOZ61_004495 [Ophidiomyces ophidiicola]KAI1932482.1 hypothetical protein LOZ62_006643 [Ophidiomyces ophidiicola]KAI1960527.1 hypothetical protein LOZ59_002600 [Ophidiomyces ophidiicola]KAI1962294.1 hypothetical protein LOZ56_006617 [Ophidiomyces ophidiicola]
MSNFSRPNPSEFSGGASANYYDPRADMSGQQIQQGGSGAPGGGDGGFGGFDFGQAIKQAKYHNNGREDADDDEDAGFFKKAVSFLSQNKESLGKEDIDEQKVVGAHQALYGDGGNPQADRKLDADFLGNGAALQALKMFMGGEDKQKSSSGGGGAGDQNKLIGLAMAQAGKLWDQQNKQGNVATDKQSAVNSAAAMAMKMYMKNQMSGGGGGGGLGGLAGLAGLAGGLGGGQSGGGNQQQGGAGALLGMAKKFL